MEKYRSHQYYDLHILCDVSAKLEKTESSNVSKTGGETAKLATLTKAIDSIQENSKSLETMGWIKAMMANVNLYL